MSSLLLLVLAACDNSDNAEPQPDTVTRTDEFISAKVDGKYYDCKDVFFLNGNVPDTVFNVFRTYTITSGYKLRQVDMFRMEKPGTSARTLSLIFNDVDLDAITVPFEINPSTRPQLASLTFGDYAVGQGPGGNPDPNRHSSSTAVANGLVVKILSKDNDILTGTFRGPVFNAGKQSKTITEGQFRIKLMRKTRM